VQHFLALQHTFSQGRRDFFHFISVYDLHHAAGLSGFFFSMHADFMKTGGRVLEYGLQLSCTENCKSRTDAFQNLSLTSTSICNLNSCITAGKLHFKLGNWQCEWRKSKASLLDRQAKPPATCG
jgi:hypothetical protein